MNTLRDQWASYHAECMPETASLEQRVETRRAFYAGAAAFYALLGRLESPDFSEREGLLLLDALRQELEAFRQAVGGGRA